MSAAECQLVAALTTKTLTTVRTEEAFSLFWERCKKAATELKINEPVLPRKGQCPIRYFLGETPSNHHDSVKHYYHQIYFESIDTIVNCIRSRFEQKDYESWKLRESWKYLTASNKRWTIWSAYLGNLFFFMEMTWTNIISTCNLQYLERFLMALIRRALTYHLSLIDCVSWHNHKKICSQKS